MNRLRVSGGGPPLSISGVGIFLRGALPPVGGSPTGGPAGGGPAGGAGGGGGGAGGGVAAAAAFLCANSSRSAWI